jgi:hypothetical protein
MGFANIDQLGIVVPKLEDAMNAYAGILVGVFFVFEVNETNSRFSGSSSAFRTRFAVAQVGVTSVELIEPVAGRTIHSEYLKNSGPGVHHLGLYVRSLSRSTGHFRKKGYTAVMEGEIGGLGKFAYFNAPNTHSTIEALQLSLAWPVFLAKHATRYTPRQA